MCLSTREDRGVVHSSGSTLEPGLRRTDAHPVRLTDLGAGTAGVWTRADALQAVSPAVVRGLLAAGTWQAVWPGVYADGGYVLSPEQRAQAAVLAGGGALVAGAPRRLRTAAAGRTAARVHGLVLVDDDDPATGAHEARHDDVLGWTHGRGTRMTGDGRVLHRREVRLEAGDVVCSPGGLWLTSLPRTISDCAGLLSHEALVCLLDDALHRRLLARGELGALVRSRAGLPGVDRLRRAAALADCRAESPAETLARLLLLPVLPHLVPQRELRERSGRLIARFDLADEATRLAVEIDGRRGHAGEVMRAKDARRDRAALAAGWRTERGTWFDTRRRQAAFVATVVAAARAR